MRISRLHYGRRRVGAHTLFGIPKDAFMKDFGLPMAEMNLGIITVSKELLSERTGMFSAFNPVDIQYDHFRKVYKVVCYSELFDRVHFGEIPEYEILFTKNRKGDILTTAERIEI